MIKVIILSFFALGCTSMEKYQVEDLDVQGHR